MPAFQCFADWVNRAIRGRAGDARISLVGLLERTDRAFPRMGYDSMVVLVAYATGLVGLYR